MEIFTDYLERNIRLTDERLAHILDGHEDLKGFEFAIQETIKSPDIVVQSNSNENAHLYYRWYTETNVGDNYLCVVVIILEEDAFIVSAYMREQIRRGRVIWERSQ